MARSTRNSRDAALPIAPISAGASNLNSSTTTVSLSPVDRQALISDVVQAVLAATGGAASTPLAASASQFAVAANPPQAPSSASSSTITQPIGESSQGTWSIPVPSFACTFSMPPASAAISSALATAPIVSPSLVSTPGAVSSPPGLHQPFVVGPGCSPVPAKLVTQIVGGKFVDLSDLIAANLVESENDPQLVLDGRIVLTSTPAKRNRRRVEDIATWTEAFSIYNLVLVSHFPHRSRDLLQYQLLILSTYRQFKGRAWLTYDKAFREHAAASKLTDWSVLHGQLYAFHTAGSVPRSPAQANDSSEPSGSSTNGDVCRSWNRGQCSSRFRTCRYVHKCASCSGVHRVTDCPDIFRNDSESSAKRSAPADLSSNKSRRR